MKNKLIIIEDIVASGEGINVHIFQANKNCGKRTYTDTRNIIMDLASSLTRLTYDEIAEYCGKKNHSSVNHAQKVVAELRETNKQFVKKYDDYTAKCKAAIKESEYITGTITRAIYNAIPKSIDIKISDTITVKYNLSDINEIIEK